MKKYFYDNPNIVKNSPYFKIQKKKAYESTKQFFYFLKKKKLYKKNVIDLGCGSGSNLAYYRTLNATIKMKGVDINKLLIKSAQEDYKNLNIEFNCKDLKKLKTKDFENFQLGISMQTLSFLKDKNLIFKILKKSKLKHFACSSLFWNGNLDFDINVNYLDPKKKYKTKFTAPYNFFSINKYVYKMKQIGFKKNYIKKFYINKKLHIRKKSNMGTYTINNNKKLVQISGPLLMNWYFILSSR